VHLWSFCIGARNALAGVGGLVGLWIVNRGDETVGTAVVVTVLVYMLLSSLAMGVADLLGYWLPRGGSVRGTIASSVLPAVALIVLAV
jgi:putative membrane protein